MSNLNAPAQALAHAAMAQDTHIDDAVDRLVARIGWDQAFLTLAELDQERAATGMYSMVCGLFISDGS